MSTATPLYAGQRRSNYIRQNNGRVILTPRQRRRLKHKLNRELVAQAKAAKA